VNAITEFSPGEDAITLAGLDLSFEVLNLQQDGSDTAVLGKFFNRFGSSRFQQIPTLYFSISSRFLLKLILEQ
ncbi:MAG: hypothetical protein BRC37_17110, partial [Cyanobacteria bacterium QH_3_48_40]